jgi:hypothetical protein
MQLDLCLSSLHKFRTNFSAIVIYKADSQYKNSYKKLQEAYPHISFWRQSGSIFKNVIDCIKTYRNDFVCFLPDDCFFYRQSSVLSEKVLKEALVYNNIVSCISLRIGLNINKIMYQGEYFNEGLKVDSIYCDDNETLYFNRNEYVPCGYFNYPLSVDGHIFNTNTVLEHMEELDLVNKIKNWSQDPNNLEAAWQRFVAQTPPMVGMMSESCVVNSPNNRVQNSFLDNLHGTKYKISEADLLKLFNDGKRINAEKLDIKKIECPHTEIDLLKGLV